MKKSLLLIALLAGAAHAEPSKEETINFLQEKLNTVTNETNTFSGKTISYKETQSFEEISPCVFKYSGSFPRIDEFGETYGHDEFISIFDASTLDPESVKVTGGGGYGPIDVEVHTLRDKKIIKHSQIFYDPRDLSYCDDKDIVEKNKCVRTWQYYSMTFGKILSPTQKNAPKVAKALRHLIKLCGGKPELF